MDHVKPDQLQLLLTGDLDQEETDRVQAHLSRCSQCESLLAAIAADDASLSEALALTPEDAAWIEAQDLRPVVARRIAPWFLQPQGLLLLLGMITAAGWMVQQTAALLVEVVSPSGPVSFTLELLQLVGGLTWNFLNHVSSGGPLATLWPLALVVALTVWIQRRKGSHA